MLRDPLVLRETEQVNSAMHKMGEPVMAIDKKGILTRIRELLVLKW